jgi:hypothetical protein
LGKLYNYEEDVQPMNEYVSEQEQLEFSPPARVESKRRLTGSVGNQSLKMLEKLQYCDGSYVGVLKPISKCEKRN